MRRAQIKSKNGFTLLEVIISAALLSIIIIPLSMVALSTVKISKNGEYKQKASAVAQKIAEELKVNLASENNISIFEGKIQLTTIDNITYQNSSADLGEGFIGDISLKKSLHFTTTQQPNVVPDITIRMINDTSFEVSGTNVLDGATYSSQPFNNILANNPDNENKPYNLYIEEKKADNGEKLFNIYKATNIDKKDLLFALSEGVKGENEFGKIKIEYASNMENSIFVSSFNKANLDNLLSIYCYKNGNQVKPIKILDGNVRIYDNLNVINASENTKAGVYDLYIKISKNIDGNDKKVYELRTSINLQY